MADAIGRVGCFLAGGCWPFNGPWAVIYHNPEAHLTAGTPLKVPLHPTPLYMSFLEALFSLAMYRYYRHAHLGLSGTMRFGIEYVRAQPPDLTTGPLTLAQWMAIAVGLMGAVLVLAGWREPAFQTAAP
jgi:prolipoprotein diacylglyceryltransferase